jgi:hypothetical protein
MTRPLSPSELIAVWERAIGQHPIDRALTLLSACSGEPREVLAALSIGQRDARLLEVFEQLFGDSLAAFAECPRCQERLEYEVSVRTMVAQSNAKAETDLSVTSGKLSLQIRLLNSFDLAAVAACNELEPARRMLAERCVVTALQDGNAVTPESLPDSAVDLVAARLAKADPQAEILIALACTACQHSWEVVFDIESFLWAKLTSAVKRLLREVHILARAYGWRETDTLALSPFRRQCYLEMIGA